MLSSSGQMTVGLGWSFEVKWDGFGSRVDGGSVAGAEPARLEHHVLVA
jgi:hypothetical protein